MRRLSLLSLFAAGSLLVFAAGSASAARITSRLTLPGESRSEDPAVPATTSDTIRALPGDYVFDIFLLLEGAESAATFEGEFALVGDLASYNVTLNLGFADPGVSPFGRGTWDALGNITADDRVLLSHLPVDLNNPNVAGERLLATLLIDLLVDPSSTASLLSVFYTSGTATMEPDAMSIPISTPGGRELLQLVPEPGTGLLLAGGLLAFAARRRGHPR